MQIFFPKYAKMPCPSPLEGGWDEVIFFEPNLCSSWHRLLRRTLVRSVHWSSFIAICCLFFLCNNLIAQNKNSEPINANNHYNFLSVENFINRWIDSGYYPGASIIIAKDNRIIYKKYLGNYTPETVEYIASAGKWLAAATIAALVDEGKLSWNDKVNKWLPQFTDVKGQATLKQLLSHTSGFPDYQPQSNHPDDYQTLKESVANIIKLPADTLPGIHFHYGGLAMQVAGRMVEIASGKNWETLFREKIAIPLSMMHTHFTPVDKTQGHNPMLGGGARTTLQDYANFLSMIINNGMFEGKRILSAKVISEMQANQIGNAKVNNGEFVEKARGTNRKDIYGLGEWREETNENGEPVLISSPGWAGAYPWIDKTNNVYGFFLTHVNVEKAKKNNFSSFYASPVLPVLVRDILKDAPSFKTKKALLKQK